MKNKYNIGDMFTMTHGSEFYRGIICEIDKDIEDEYVIYWTYPNQIINSVGYTKSQIQYWIDEKKLIHYPVKE